ncbi:hypothetical protein LPB136_09695 [Tenacibaculum todarodis]|uniref:Uncharacterized protein n=1 Tax=Tenacibaculum todarodis TaxID=1850252 RepID=A0A1L3JKD5_9FLAO|nr:hypothetical protein LPB136_09695 [Tenacibaculum todarodis]
MNQLKTITKLKTLILLNIFFFLFSVFIFSNLRILGNIASARDLIQFFSAVSVVLFIITIVKKYKISWIITSAIPAIIFGIVALSETL